MPASRGGGEADCVDVERRKFAHFVAKSVSGPISRQSELGATPRRAEEVVVEVVDPLASCSLQASGICYHIELTKRLLHRAFLKDWTGYNIKGPLPPSSRAPFKAPGAYAGSLGTPPRPGLLVPIWDNDPRIGS